MAVAFRTEIPCDLSDVNDGDLWSHAMVVDLQETPRPIGFISYPERGSRVLDCEEYWFTVREAEALHNALEGALAAHETLTNHIHDVVRADRIVELLERNTQRRVYGEPVPKAESTELLGLVLADVVADAA